MLQRLEALPSVVTAAELQGLLAEFDGATLTHAERSLLEAVVSARDGGAAVSGSGVIGARETSIDSVFGELLSYPEFCEFLRENNLVLSTELGFPGSPRFYSANPHEVDGRGRAALRRMFPSGDLTTDYAMIEMDDQEVPFGTVSITGDAVVGSHLRRFRAEVNELMHVNLDARGYNPYTDYGFQLDPAYGRVSAGDISETNTRVNELISNAGSVVDDPGSAIPRIVRARLQDDFHPDEQHGYSEMALATIVAERWPAGGASYAEAAALLLGGDDPQTDSRFMAMLGTDATREVVDVYFRLAEPYAREIERRGFHGDGAGEWIAGDGVSRGDDTFRE